MSIRFAGSRCVDERRRRRLAQEADAPSEVVSRAVSAEVDPNKCRLPRGSSPVDSLISPRLWKHVVVAALAGLAWGAVLMIGRRADQAADGLESIVGLAAGKLTTFFSTVMLLAAGQLAFINLWYRSRSRKDFSGSYKLWFYTAVGWLTLCAFQATGAHWNLSDAVLAGRPVAIWNARLLVWLIPAAILVTALYQLLLREMRDCTLSVWTLRLSGIAAATAVAAWVFGPFVCTPSTELLTASASATLWHLLLALSMLFHARHVIHLSNEPPQSSIVRRRLALPAFSWLRSFGRRQVQIQPDVPRSRPMRTAKTNRAAPVQRTAGQPVVTDDKPDQQPAQTPDSAGTSVTTAPRAAAAAAAVEAPLRPATSQRVDPPHAVAQAKGPVFAAPTQRRPVHAATTARSDSDPDDDEDLATLSKKERRRMKKRARAGDV